MITLLIFEFSFSLKSKVMSLEEFSGSVPDMRSSKNCVFKASQIVFIAMVSVLRGAETWKEVEMFGKCNHQFRWRLHPLREG